MLNTEHPASGESPAMQFILNGRLYDTESSVAVAISRGILDSQSHYGHPDLPSGAESCRYESVLYRTKGGNFFAHYHSSTKFARGKPIVEDEATHLTPEEAVKWIEDRRAMLLDSTGLPLPDEA